MFGWPLVDPNIAAASEIDTTTMLTGYTAGSILFSTGTAIGQDNANLFWDDTNNQLVLGAGTAAAPSYTFASDQNMGAYRVGADIYGIATAGVERLTIDATGDFFFTQGVSTSGSPIGFNFTGAAHTTLAASTEALDVRFRLDRTVQFATGALATQRAFQINAPTYSFAGASTITTAATLYVAGAPVAGTNATISNAYAFWIDAGNTRIDGVVFAELGSATAAAYSFQSAGTTDPNTGIYSTGADNTSIAAGGTQIASFATTGTRLTQAVSTSGTPTGLTFSGAAHTTLAAQVELNSVNFDLSATVVFATGPIPNQRAFIIQAPVYDFTGASTITDAATFYVDTGPDAGPNFATITNSYAIWAGSNIRSDGVIRVALGSVTAAAYSFHSGGFTDPNTGIYSTGADNVSVAAGGRQIASFATTGTTLAQAIATSGSPTGFIFTGAAHTTLAASTEASDVDFRLDRTVQLATGALATQRAFQIANPTYGFVAASTITDAATLYIEGAPVAGTNATISNAYAIWVDAGTTRLDGAVLVSDGSLAAPAIGFASNVDVGFYMSTGSNELTGVINGVEKVRISVNGVYTPNNFISQGFSSTQASDRCSFSGFAGLTITQTAQTSGTNAALLVTGAASTNQTASTEVTDVDFNLARTVTFANGTITTQRAVRVQAPTYAFTTTPAGTITTAATVAISGGPTQGTNATISQSINLHMEGGAVTLASGASVLSATIVCAARTVTFTGTTQITGGANAQVLLQSITYTDSSALTMDIAATLSLASPIGAGSVAITQACGLRMAENVSYAKHAAGFLYNGIRINNHTVTFTETAQITSTATAGIFIGQITLTNAGAHTIDNAASLYIGGALIAGGSVTITNNYAIWVDAGVARFDGDGTTVFAVPTVAATDTTITRKIRVLDGQTAYWIAATTSQ